MKRVCGPDARVPKLLSPPPDLLIDRNDNVRVGGEEAYVRSAMRV